jgi:serine O-acetyltransferase
MTISASRLLPHILIMLFCKSSAMIKTDLIRWAEIFRFREPKSKADFALVFIKFMTFTPEFRNLFYLRSGLTGLLFSWLCPRLDSLEIVTNSIGPGLFIQHGESTYISAESIGANCWIGRFVMVGYTNETDRPTIGNNVRICPGAKIIGKVKIGDNATIGLNTVITQDVSAGTTLLGVPGKVIWKVNVAPT